MHQALGIRDTTIFAVEKQIFAKENCRSASTTDLQSAILLTSLFALSEKFQPSACKFKWNVLTPVIIRHANRNFPIIYFLENLLCP
jgi:hypothetical protein